MELFTDMLNIRNCNEIVYKLYINKSDKVPFNIKICTYHRNYALLHIIISSKLVILQNKLILYNGIVYRHAQN